MTLSPATISICERNSDRKRVSKVMKNTAIKFLLMMVAALIAGSPGPVKANGASFTVNGRWAGTAFANPAFDFNNDGIAARTFDVKTYDQVPFAGMEGVVDAGLVSIDKCAPGALELKPFGKLTFRGRAGEGLYAEIDPTAPNLCFDPVHPSEVLAIRFVNGTGVYSHASGTGTLTIHDLVRFPEDPPPGSPPSPPLMIDTRGEFVLHVNL
jgi:hypothetical protein